jgi:hypothetical protein
VVDIEVEQYSEYSDFRAALWFLALAGTVLAVVISLELMHILP